MSARRPRRGEIARKLLRDLQSVAPPTGVVLLWRWRWELGILAGLAAGITLLITRLGWIWIMVLPGIAAVAFAWPEARSWLIAHIRCIVTAHRVRTGCAQAWIQTRTGRLPVILVTRVRPYGEQVFIWCRAGITPRDFERARDILRVTCWAADILVSVSPRHPQIVILDVIRDGSR